MKKLIVVLVMVSIISIGSLFASNFNSYSTIGIGHAVKHSTYKIDEPLDVKYAGVTSVNFSYSEQNTVGAFLMVNLGYDYENPEELELGGFVLAGPSVRLSFPRTGLTFDVAFGLSGAVSNREVTTFGGSTFLITLTDFGLGSYIGGMFDSGYGILLSFGVAGGFSINQIASFGDVEFDVSDFKHSWYITPQVSLGFSY